MVVTPRCVPPDPEREGAARTLMVSETHCGSTRGNEEMEFCRTRISGRKCRKVRKGRCVVGGCRGR